MKEGDRRTFSTSSGVVHAVFRDLESNSSGEWVFELHNLERQSERLFTIAVEFKARKLADVIEGGRFAGRIEEIVWKCIEENAKHGNLQIGSEWESNHCRRLVVDGENLPFYLPR